MIEQTKRAKMRWGRILVVILALVGMVGGGVVRGEEAWAECTATDDDGHVISSTVIDCSDTERLAWDTECGNGGVLGFRPWYKGLVKVELDKEGNAKKCEVASPAAGDDTMAVYIWTIILNVLVDVFSAAGIVTVGMIVYGGYFLIRSGGDPSRVVKGKKIITTAVIGLVIVLLASVISNTLILVLQSALT